MIQSADNAVEGYRERVSKFSSELDLGLVFYIFKKSLWIVVLLFIIALTSAFLYLRYSQPVYQSSAVIQINDNTEASKVLQIGTSESGTNKIAEAIEQIRSKIFLKRVVEKSDVQVSYFNEGTFKSNELYKSSPYLIKFNIKKSSIYGSKIYIKFATINSGTLNFAAEGRSYVIPFSTNNVVNSAFFDLYVSLNTGLDKSQVQNTLTENNKAYFIINDVNAVTTELQTKLGLKSLNDAAKTILVTVKDINANKTKDLVNIISEEYLTFDVERKSESSKSIITFIDDQLKKVYESLKESENNLQDFRKDKNFTDKDAIVSVNMLRINTLEDEMLKLEMEEKLLTELQANILLLNFHIQFLQLTKSIGKYLCFYF